MKRKRSFFSVLGVSMLAALALTAITASSASASGTGLFLLNLNTIATYPQKVEGSGGAGTMLVLGVVIECLKASFQGNITATTAALGKAVFKECNIPNSDVCLIETKEITTNNVSAELLLLGTIVRFKPEGAPNFATVPIHSDEEECALVNGLLESLPITGQACAEVVESDKLKLLLSSSHCNPGLKLGANNAVVHAPNPILVEQLGSKITTHA
jgi:hypothetical protein